MKLFYLVLFTVLLDAAISGGEKAPLPASLTAAKCALLTNDGVSAKLLDKVYSELKKWNRFRLVDNKSDADIVVTLSRGATSGVLVGRFGAVVSDYSVRITDSKDDAPLWSDSLDGGYSTRYAGDSIVSHLRKRMENK